MIEKIDVKIEDGLIVVPEASVPAIFSSEDSMKIIIDMIRKEVTGHEPDLTTAKGRAAIASLSAKVSKSKVVLENLGKGLTEEWRKKTNIVNAAKKFAIGELESLRDEVRKPLTDWEEEEKRIALEEQRKREEEDAANALKEEIERCHAEAILEDEVQTLRKEKAERERIEQERIEKERKEKEEHDKIERIRNEEKERSEREAQEKIQREKDEAERKIREAQEEADRKIKEERERLEREEQERIRLEQEEKDRIAAEEAEAERKANLKRNITKKNNEAKEDFLLVLPGSAAEAEELAKAIISAIAKGQIRNVKMVY